MEVIIIVGPTGVGKTEYALSLARTMNGAIISADSMQVYTYMDIGSAKPSKAELAEVPHYLIDEIDPREKFSVFEYKVLAEKYIKEVIDAGKQPIVCGGTGLYVNALLYQMDFEVHPENQALRKQLYEEAERYGNDYLHKKVAEIDEELANRLHPNNVKRVVRAIELYETQGVIMKEFKESKVPNPNFDFSITCLTRPREELYERINQRVDMMMEMGLIEEVKGLMSMGLTESHMSMKGIGYKEIIQYLKGQITLEEAVNQIKQGSRRYAKRQLTWFKSYEEAKWINLSENKS